MKNIFSVILVVSVTLSFLACRPAVKETAEVSRGNFPHFSLKDPLGRMHTADEILKGGLVLVVTAPTLRDESAQRGWDKYLLKSMPKGKMQLVYLEDMVPSAFKKTALKSMKKDFKPGVPPLLLIDHDGKVREKLGVEKNRTEVLVYDENGNLLHSEKGKPSAAGAKAIWNKLKS